MNENFKERRLFIFFCVHRLSRFSRVVGRYKKGETRSDEPKPLILSHIAKREYLKDVQYLSCVRYLSFKGLKSRQKMKPETRSLKVHIQKNKYVVERRGKHTVLKKI